MSELTNFHSCTDNKSMIQIPLRVGGLGTQLEIGLRTRKSLHVKGGLFWQSFLVVRSGSHQEGYNFRDVCQVILLLYYI
jgi:hypothetical protein